jgi:hypothetical protein
MSQVFRKAYRRTIHYLLAVVMLAGMATLPNEVLCIAPGGHFAIEVVSGGICSEDFGSGMRTRRAQPDGCPANCRDTQIGNQAQCNDARPFSPAPLVFVFAAPPIDPFSLVGTFAGASRFAFRSPPQGLLTTVIRC